MCECVRFLNVLIPIMAMGCFFLFLYLSTKSRDISRLEERLERNEKRLQERIDGLKVDIRNLDIELYKIKIRSMD